MGQFTAFVFTEPDAVVPVKEFLQKKGYEAFANPTQHEVEKYVPASARRVIVRQAITEEPVNGDYATIEKTLVDLYLEKDRLYPMDDKEYNRIFDNVILEYRVNMGRIFRYSDRRKVRASILGVVARHPDLIIH